MLSNKITECNIPETVLPNIVIWNNKFICINMSVYNTTGNVLNVHKRSNVKAS